MKTVQLFFLLLIILFSCELPETKRGNNKVNRSEFPDQTADSVDIVYSEEGIIKLKLRSPYLVMRDESGAQINEFPQGLVMDFYDDVGSKNADLKADFGYDDNRNRERYVRGNVVIQHEKQGWIYTTEELFIDEKKDSIHNNGKPVKITKPDGTLIQGDSFRSNSRMDVIEIKNVFDSTVPIEENQVNSGEPNPRPTQNQRPRRVQ